MATDDRAPVSSSVPPLENTAFFDIDERDGYVRIDQSWGNQPLYTPAEARNIADAIVEAADAAASED